MKKTFLALAAASVLPLAIGHAQSPFTATYTFGTNGNTNSFAYNGTPVAGLTVSNLVKSAGINTSSSADNFRASAWTTLASIDTNEYIGFSVTADAGLTFSMADFNFGIGRSAAGTRRWAWYASTNNFASSFVLSNYTTLNPSLTQTNGVLTNPDANSGWTNNVLDLSSLTNLSTIEFRLYSYDAEQASGTAGLQGAFTFTGTVNTSGLSWYADGVSPGGTGTWSTTASNWFDSTSSSFVVWGSSNQASFGSPGGTVTVAPGGITAADGLDFLAAYTLDGDVITLGSGANTISVTPGVTTVISNELAGTLTGLTKSGAGTLVLAGSNSFSGGSVTLSAGTLSIASDRALGNTNNDLVVNGTLRTTVAMVGSNGLSAGRDLSGAGTYDITSFLTVHGNVSNSATTLVHTGTLDLLGAVRGLGALTVNAPMILSAAGEISAASVNTAGVTNGTVDISPALAFTVTGDKPIVANTNVTVVLNGNVSGIPGHRLVKAGDGQLALNGSNSILGVRIGVAAASPTNGGIVILNNANAAGTGQIQFNYGTLRTDQTNGLTATSGLSIGGRDGAVAVFGGTSNLRFNGTNSFFWALGTSGEMRLDVDNETTLAGAFDASGGSGSATGITIGGAGLLVLDGNAAALTEPLTLSNVVTLELNNVLGGTVLVRPGTTLTGIGTVNGGITVDGVIAPGSAAASGNLTSLGAVVMSNGTAQLRLFANGINDQLSSLGGLFFGGSVLNIVTEGAYVPVLGDSFSLVGFGPLDTNLPSLINLPVLATNRVWNTSRLLTEGFITVDDANPLPPNYANWLTNFPTLTPPDDAGGADPDGDGFNNYTEFAFGTDPVTTTAALMTGRGAPGAKAVFNWLQRKNPPGGASYIIKRTDNLAGGPWGNAADLVVTNAANTNGILLPDEYERKEFTVTVSNRAFYYIEANVQP